MMNGWPAQAVRALMGAAELYITLLSVCERLLKALKSPGSGVLPAAKLPQTAANDGVSPAATEKAALVKWRPAVRRVRR